MPLPASTGTIKVRGARIHNLKNVSVDIPRNRLVVITGLSGSGKSSLAFDTIYAEGQRRYAESLSAYARQFMDLMDKPDVDALEGLSPTISIDQKLPSNNPRSTVGTITEIYDFLRLLFARLGTPHCPHCRTAIERQTVAQIVDRVAVIVATQPVIVLAPVTRMRIGDHRKLLQQLTKSKYAHVRVDGVMYVVQALADLTLDPYTPHTIEVVVDRLPRLPAVTDNELKLVTGIVTQALDLGDGLMSVLSDASDEVWLFNQYYICGSCGYTLADIEPRTFSFNSPAGACADCTGLGYRLEVDPQLVMPNQRLTLAEGAIRPWARNFTAQTMYWQLLAVVSDAHGFTLHTPIRDLTPAQRDIIINGSGEQTYTLEDGPQIFPGVLVMLREKYNNTKSEYLKKEIENYMRLLECPVCHGRRLNSQALAITINDLSIADVTRLSIAKATEWCALAQAQWQKSTDRHAVIARPLLQEVARRLRYVCDVGLYYLTLDRSVVSLSGGEAQRVRLATQIGSALEEVIYVLDEPSIGLHPRDNTKLIETLQHLRDQRNSVLVVEHDPATILAADQVIDMGPGAGQYGGEILAQGTPAEIMRNKKSITGQYLSGVLGIERPASHRAGNGKKIVIEQATAFNLKDITVEFPLGLLVCVTGVSGSGKSTLMGDILAKALAHHFYRAKDLPAAHKQISGLEHLDKVITIDQSPIGRTPRSNPATYTGVFTLIRDLFTQLPEARMKGLTQGHFSFNVKDGGRCEVCGGEGMVQVEMQFLPDVYVSCDGCHGRRYKPEALEIHYKGKSIADVLDMDVEQALDFFSDQSAIVDKLQVLHEVGLGYLHLGQSATTLSGGEAQRIKLATELSRRATGRTLYILDEPTTGLHFADVGRLLQVLNRLVEKGNSVFIVEHNLDVIKSADWVIDLGPDGGDAGGYLVAAGTPEQVAAVTQSITGQYLQPVLAATSSKPGRKGKK